MDKKRRSMIRYDREVNGLSYRTLGKKYGEAISTLHAMINKKPKKGRQARAIPPAAEQDPAADVQALKEELRKARLMIELQDLMIDIASKELGVDIRKKPGTRQSE